MLARHFGALPPREIKVRLLRLPASIRLRVLEDVEVARARRALPPLPRTTFATVIPTIGRSYLAEAVESALAQTVADHHVVVVSDGRPLPELPRDRRLTGWT